MRTLYDVTVYDLCINFQEPHVGRELLARRCSVLSGPMSEFFVRVNTE
jgi:hypothetical protein